MQTLPFEGHNVAYQCKGLYQSNIVCEYEVNLPTNENVIIEKTKLEHKLLKNNVEYQGHLKVKVMMLHVGEKVLKMIKLLKNNVKCQGCLKVKVIVF